MESIKRIAAPSGRSTFRGRDRRVSHAPDDADAGPSARTPRATAALDGETPSFRPAAPFLAQYVDQSFSWPRAPLRKEGERLRATRAYITADMLLDLLAETLRLRPNERKL